MADARTLILTRPRAQSEAFAAALERRLPGRYRAVIAPVIEIIPLPARLDLADVQGLIFTSANGVEQFAALSPERRLPAWCVGDMTAAAARRAGLSARSADGDVAALAALVASAHRPGDGAFLHLRGLHAAGDLTGRLAAAGIPVHAAEIYDQVPCPLSAEARGLLDRGTAEVVSFFSPRSARVFAGQAAAAGWDLGPVTAVSLSRAADDAVASLAPGRRRVAATPTRDGMLALLAAL